MHELSIAENIIEYATEFAKQHKAERVLKLELEIGQLSGVIKESLEFAFEETLKNTVLENATIIISETKGIARCNNCGTEFENPDWYTPCPECTSVNSEIIKGKELLITSIVLA
jgi:hydrogenase nickel incorporation protein HypA/HybF